VLRTVTQYGTPWWYTPALHYPQHGKHAHYQWHSHHAHSLTEESIVMNDQAKFGCDQAMEENQGRNKLGTKHSIAETSASWMGLHLHHHLTSISEA
jgi:hypothetical protein